MIRFFSFLAFAFMLLTVPVMAQEDADKVLAEQDAGQDAGQVESSQVTRDEGKQPIKPLDDRGAYEARLTLSRQMHEIWPIRTRMESAIDAVSQNVPAVERVKFKAGMRQAIKFGALEAASIDAMADIFTAKELEAMIAFYGSKEGRSVSHKTGDYEHALQPILTKMLDKALLDVKLGAP